MDISDESGDENMKSEKPENRWRVGNQEERLGPGNSENRWRFGNPEDYLSSENPENRWRFRNPEERLSLENPEDRLRPENSENRWKFGNPEGYLSSENPEDCYRSENPRDSLNFGKPEESLKYQEIRRGTIRVKGSNFRNFSSLQCIQVITAVEANPCLWNKRDSNFKDSGVKRQLWVALEKSLDFLYADHGVNIRKIWNSLEAAYKVERTKQKPSGSGASAILRDFDYYRDMKFLEASYRDKSPPGSSKSEKGLVKRVLEIDATPRRQRKEAKLEISNADKEFENLLKKSAEILNSIAERRKPENTEYSKVVDVVLKTMKSLDTTSQLMFQGEIGLLCQKYSNRKQNLNNMPSASTSIFSEHDGLDDMFD
ncbi:hypothetical protein B9Z55_021128 [Caenorhabditis nigoni]|uniref:MADF domain-containing protein n=1 Tax=Caenorhabditis nigoni TaxID=1611254 RepID=A0A2G5TQL2_9PELO|nr:hypothetical protein B9Z55_021128 [Caenorhabditis nigoni]